ncbi:MAG: hypothetical protein ACE364_08100 [Chlorobiota bacterium]
MSYRKYKGIIYSKDINKALREISKLINLNETPLKEIALSFLNIFIEENCYECSFNELLTLYKERFEESNLEKEYTNNEYEFYKFICKTYLYIVENNISEELLNKNVRKDLKEIYDLRQRLLDDKASIEESKESGKSYKIQKLDHYLSILRQEEDKIIYFFVNGLMSESKKQNRIAVFGTVNALLLNSFYSYSFKKSTFINYFTDVKHKLLKYPIIKVNNLVALRNENLELFEEKLDSLVNYDEIIDSIKLKIKDSHLLFKEYKLVTDILELFTNKKYTLFSFITPIQIEGLISLFCKELGISENQINKLPVNKKVEIIQKNKGWRSESAYSYFSFDFPILRNKVAHGYGLDKKQAMFFSKMFLLDLNFIVESFDSETFKQNQLLHLIRMSKNYNDLKYLINAVSISKDELDSYYQESHKDLEQLKLKFEKTYSLEKLKKIEFENDELEGLKNSFINIKKQGILENECIDTLNYLNFKLDSD